MTKLQRSEEEVEQLVQSHIASFAIEGIELTPANIEIARRQFAGEELALDEIKAILDRENSAPLSAEPSTKSA